MGQPIVHFEVIGKYPDKLRDYYGALFGWEYDTSDTVSEAISEPTNYGFVDPKTNSDGVGIPGGVGGGASYPSHTICYIGVPDVEATLQKAESLGGIRRLGPSKSPSGLVIGQFTDPEGNLVGVAGTV